MARPGIVSSRSGLLLAVAGILCAGCGQNAVYTRTIPEGASPIYKWEGERTTGLRTFWGDEAVSLEVSAYFPEDWEHADDGYWNVEGKTGDGEPIAFIGVVRRYVNEHGTELAKITADLEKLDDWVYFVIDPNVTKENGKIISIQPVAYLREVRRHAIIPWFNAEVRLLPEKESPLTPSPEPLPEEPEGTPISID